MSVGVMEDYKLRDLRASHTLVGRKKKPSIIKKTAPLHIPRNRLEETEGRKDGGHVAVQHDRNQPLSVSEKLRETWTLIRMSSSLQILLAQSPMKPSTIRWWPLMAIPTAELP
jgi:hypothetical protein